MRAYLIRSVNEFFTQNTKDKKGCCELKSVNTTNNIMKIFQKFNQEQTPEEFVQSVGEPFNVHLIVPDFQLDYQNILDDVENTLIVLESIQSIDKISMNDFDQYVKKNLFSGKKDDLNIFIRLLPKDIEIIDPLTEQMITKISKIENIKSIIVGNPQVLWSLLGAVKEEFLPEALVDCNMESKELVSAILRVSRGVGRISKTVLDHGIQMT